ncbi:beta-lactamase family protein [Micrococcales bacterium 31B]|nr:beta-lactamase family protein [Micrococcales bacterium 31B]
MQSSPFAPPSRAASRPGEPGAPALPNALPHSALADALSAIDAAFVARVADTAPSTCYGIARGHEPLAHGGAGAVRLGPDGSAEGYGPEPTTAYRIASCTKSFIAASILLLRDRGLLALDDDVRQYVPEARFVAKPGAMSVTENRTPTPGPVVLPQPDTATKPVPLAVGTEASASPETPGHAGPLGGDGFVPTGERITLRHLLTMGAGLPTDNPWGDRQESQTDAEFTALLKAGVPLATAPGTHYDYSNLGYALLGRVIERVAERSCLEFVSGEFLAVLDLNGTAFDAPTLRAWHEDGDVQVAEGFTRRGDTWEHQPHSGPGAFSPIGGLFSGTADLLTWAAYLTEAFDPHAHERGPLSKASRREMQTTQRLRHAGGALPATGYGFGLVTLDDPHYGPVAMHAGGYPGFSAHMAWQVETGLAVVAFENGTGARVGLAVIDALQRVLQAEYASDAPLTGSGAEARLGLAGRVSMTQPAPWSETLNAASAFDAAVRAGSLAECENLVAMNFALDKPFLLRDSELAGVLAGLELSDAPGAGLAFQPGTLPNAATWRIPATGASGSVNLECHLSLSPTVPPLVQEFTVTLV